MTIEEMVQQNGGGGLAPELKGPQLEDSSGAAGGGGFGFDLSFLSKPTGAGGVEDYLDHPLNPRRSRGLAQALRGATGLFGDGLRAAIADIVFGGLEYMRERRNAIETVDIVDR